jgi:hypothetical protein
LYEIKIKYLKIVLVFTKIMIINIFY